MRRFTLLLGLFMCAVGLTRCAEVSDPPAAVVGDRPMRVAVVDILNATGRTLDTNRFVEIYDSVHEAMGIEPTVKPVSIPTLYRNKLWFELRRRGFDVVAISDVNKAMESLRGRSPSPSRLEVRRHLRENLKVDALVYGVISAWNLERGDGEDHIEVETSISMVDATTGKVLWSKATDEFELDLRSSLNSVTFFDNTDYAVERVVRSLFGPAPDREPDRARRASSQRPNKRSGD